MADLHNIAPKTLVELLQTSTFPDIQHYNARDGSELPFRHYPAASNRAMILLHGITEDSRYLFQLATSLSSNNVAHVYTPDLRGYGLNPKRRGDIDYIGQLEDDLADLIQWIRQNHTNADIILAGHSAGGGTVIRFAGSRYSDQIAAYVLLSPLIHPNAPTQRKNDPNSYTTANIKKFILLSMLDALGIQRFHHSTVLHTNKPADARHGSETLELSFRLTISRMPRMNYQKDLQSLRQPTLVLVGGNDEVFLPEQFEPLFSKYTNATTKLIPEHNHDGILFSSVIFEEIRDWAQRL